MYTMGTKKTYSPPAVLRLVGYAPQEALLAGSIVDKATVISQVDTFKWDDPDQGFNYTWE